MSGKISVAMAAYNGEKFIEEQLESILDQTLPVDEVIICDDRSSDRTAEVVRNFIEKHDLQDRFFFSVNEKNLGYASNFVNALRKTTGDYILFCDQDDIWVSDRVEKMVGVLRDNPAAELIGSEFEPFKCSEDAPDPQKWELATFRNDESLQKMEFNSANIFIGCQGCTMAMRRSFLDEVDSFWYEGWAHDEFVWKLALARESLYFYHKVTLKRRLHSSNVTLHKEHQNDKRLKYLKDLKKSHEQTRQYCLMHGTDIGKIRLLDKHIRATQKRIDLIESRKLMNFFKLFAYTDCYHKRRSIPVELMMALRA
ncbi:glycosyltransferase [Butyrivibrio sp. DSM 10294]|uniref:glycosyltransferase n=1 Tax=Butyrivibrio sp. DSM 10294 TaxID=2972457 RepID=UPI00234E5241|nr:glycosyltransferase [Butyrivibrio sp. DSM 10294]MDC7294829.1 glycosyltransferase [Butyrivibrio sp. DSM 10294]